MNDKEDKLNALGHRIVQTVGVVVIIVLLGIRSGEASSDPSMVVASVATIQQRHSRLQERAGGRRRCLCAAGVDRCFWRWKMNPRDIRTLYAVQLRGEAHIGVVATMMGVTKNAVSDQFRKLHADGLLMRRPFGVQRAVYSLSLMGTKRLEEYLVANPVPDLKPPPKAGTSVRAVRERDAEEAQEERGQRATMRQYDWKSSAPFVPDMGAAQQRNDGNKHILSKGFA